MNKKKTLIIVNCVLLLVLAVIVAVVCDSRSPDPILDLLPTESTTAGENTQTETAATGETENVTRETSATEETTQPTKPEEATDPTRETNSGEETKASGEATDPAEQVTDPTEAVTEPSGEATDPTEQETEPSGEATDPAEQVTEPSGAVTDPTEQETEPSGEATDPTEQETEPSGAVPGPTEQVTEPSSEATDPSEEDPPEPSEEQVTQPEELSPEVTIPPEVDPDTGETHFTFPCQVPGYDLVVEKLAPYDGMFVEDGTNVQSEGVAMLLIRNEGEFPVEYTQICVEYPQETLLFDISALPDGEKLVVQEKTGKKLPEGEPVSVTAMVVRRAEMEMSEDKVRVTDNGNNTLTIKNLTNEKIPTVRVFYKYYMEQEEIFVGGIAFTVRITRLNPGASVTIQPSHYTSQTTRVVMVLTYDSEV